MSTPKEKATHKAVRLAIVRIEKGRPSIVSATRKFLFRKRFHSRSFFLQNNIHHSICSVTYKKRGYAFCTSAHLLSYYLFQNFFFLLLPGSSLSLSTSAFCAASRLFPVSASNCFKSSFASLESFSGVCTTSVI